MVFFEKKNQKTFACLGVVALAAFRNSGGLGRQFAWLLIFVALSAMCQARAEVSEKLFVPTRLGQMFALRYHPNRPLHRPILLIHQTSLSHLEYTPLARNLARDREVVAIDLPGYGGSDPLPAPITIDQYADAVADAIAALRTHGGAASYDVMGTHGGSFVTCQLALAHPELVHRIVVNGLALETPAQAHARYVTIRRDEPFPATVLRLQQGLVGLLAQKDSGLDPEGISMILVDSLRSYNRRWYLFDASARYPGMDRLPHIRQKMLILTMQDDLRDDTMRSIKFIPQAQLIDLSPLARLPYYHDPARVAAVVRNFLDTP
jgi:pimeloyl-ACP methyl ester carboxylesterase